MCLCRPHYRSTRTKKNTSLECHWVTWRQGKLREKTEKAVVLVASQHECEGDVCFFSGWGGRVGTHGPAQRSAEPPSLDEVDDR